MKNSFCKLLLGFIFLLIINSAKSQFALQAHLVMPTGYLGAVLKKAPSISFGTVEDFDGRSRVRMLGNMTYFSPRQERFNIYSNSIEGSTTTIYPGVQEINLYLNLSFAFGFDFSIIQKDKFNWYIGFDLIAGMTLRQYTTDIPYVSSSGDFSGIPFIGLRGRTGIEYTLDKMSVFLDFNRTYYLNTEATILSYNDLGLGIRF
jgi:hypothetical protein